MLHNKFRGNQPTGFGEDFKRVFTIYGHGAILVMWPHHVIRFSFHCT